MYTISIEQKSNKDNNGIHLEDEEIVLTTKPFNYDLPSPILIKTEKDCKTWFGNYHQHPVVTNDSENITSSNLNSTARGNSINEEVYFTSVENEASDPLSDSDASGKQVFTTIVANESLCDTVTSLSSKNEVFDYENYDQPQSDDITNKNDAQSRHEVIDFDDRIWFSSEIVGNISNMLENGIETLGTSITSSRENNMSEIYLFEKAEIFQCIFCKNEFDRESSCIKHTSNCSQNKKRYACRICDCAYETIDQLTIHKKQHMYEDPYTKMVRYRCQNCCSKYNTEQGLIRHVKQTYPKNHTHTLVNNSELKPNNEYHPQVKWYQYKSQPQVKIWCQCCLCEKKYSTTPSLRVHLECVHSLPTEWVMKEMERIESFFSHTEPSADNFKKEKFNRFKCMVCKLGYLTARSALRHSCASLRCVSALYGCSMCGECNINVDSLCDHNHLYENGELPEWCRKFWKKLKQ